MKIEFAYRKLSMLESAEDGTLNLESVKEHYPQAVENDQINYQKIVPLLVEAVKELATAFNGKCANMDNVINQHQIQLEEINGGRNC
jgi:hypothetical protein